VSEGALATALPAAAPATLLASPDTLQLGVAVLGTTVTRGLTISNPGGRLVQWRAALQPSFFSLPQGAGLLNPGQSVLLPVLFKPGAAGQHAATLTLTAQPAEGGAPGPGIEVGQMHKYKNTQIHKYTNTLRSS
jgi:hypothetical protein